MSIQARQRYDEVTKSQYLNDEPSVYHCHHYATLATKLAMEYADLGGPAALASSMEESFYLALRKYCSTHGVSGKRELSQVCEEYYSLVGMGILSLDLSDSGGRATLSTSHMDKGWTQKWGASDQPINFMTCGYVAACAAIVNGASLGSFDVLEQDSIAMGARSSSFIVSRRSGGVDA